MALSISSPRLLLVAVVVFVWQLAAPHAVYAQCTTTLNFASVGSTQTQSLQACNTFIESIPTDTSNSRWAGLMPAQGQRVRGIANCGIGVANGAGSCSAPTAQDITTANAVYTFTGNSGTSNFSIQLKSHTNPGVTQETLTYYTYVGAPTATASQALANTTYTFTMNLPPAIALSPTSLTNGTVGTPYSQTITASGGTSPYSFAVISGSLPAGLSLDSSGALTGTPTAAGTSSFRVRATDNGSFTGNRFYSLTTDAPTITVSPVFLSNGGAGAPYSQSISAGGGTSPYSFAVTAGSLPAGLSLTSGGALSGTATTAGTSNFTVTATDAGSFTGSRAYSLTIEAPSISLSPTSLSNGAIGTSYSQSITASGGTPAYSFAVTSGSLPAGLSLASSGALTGTPTATGTSNFTVTATDAGSFTGSRSYSLTIDAPSLTVSPTSLASGTVGTAYSQSITASGGIASYSFAVTSGALPAGLSLASNGSLSGTPTAGGSFNVTITATDSSASPGPYTGARAYSLTIAAPSITVSPASLPAGTSGSAYSQSITAAGGTSSYAFSLTAGSLPSGLTLASNGTLSGTPTVDGSFGFTITATDSSTGTGPYTGGRAYSLTINSATPTITVSPASLSNGAVGTALSESITASGGTAAYSFAVTSGALPAGVTLAANGSLSGTPTAGGSFNFTVTATDSAAAPGPFTGARAYSLTIAAPAIVVSPASLSDAMIGTTYSQPLTAAGGTAPYTFAVTAGSLPAGLTLSSSGTLSGTPTTTGTSNFTVTATDNSGGSGPYSGARAYALSIVAAPAVVNVGPAGLADALVGASYGQQFSASGGTGPYRFGVTAGSLPPGLTLATDGALSGAPTATGAFNFTVSATDSSATPATGSRAYALTVVAAQVIVVEPPVLPAGAVGVPYSQTVSATGGAPPYSLTISGGSVPPGLQFAAGVLSGTPTTAGTFAFTVTAVDSTTGLGPFRGSRDYSFSIPELATPSVAIQPASLPAARRGEAYSQQLTATGRSGASFVFAIGSGRLPGGLLLQPGGLLSGTPTESGSFSFSVTATDATGASGSRDFGIDVPTAEPPQARDATPTPVTSTVTNTGSATLDLAPLITGEYSAVEVTVPPAHGTLSLTVQESSAATQGSTAGSQAAATSRRVIAVYTPEPRYQGEDSFAYVAVGPGGRSAPAVVTFNVVGARPTAATLKASAFAGRTIEIDLTSRATEGPFARSTIVATTPASAGEVRLVTTGTGTAQRVQLEVTPQLGYSGSIVVTYMLTNDFGDSAPATVTVAVVSRPDPSLDPVIRGISDAQAETTRRFAMTQIANFSQRNEQLHRDDGRVKRVTLGAGAPGSKDLDAAFNALRTVAPMMAQAAPHPQGDPAKQATAVGTDVSRRKGSIEAWGRGTVLFGSHAATGQRANLDIGTDGLSAGADVKVTDRFIAGVGIGYGGNRTTVGDEAALVTANNWIGATYGSTRPSPGTFIDWIVGGGRVGFDMIRAGVTDGGRAKGERTGRTWFGSLASGFEGDAARMRWSSYGRFEVVAAELDSYRESGAQGYDLAFAARQIDSAAATIGGRVERAYQLGVGTVRPHARFEWRHEFSKTSAQALDYADFSGDSYLYSIPTAGWQREQFRLGIGAALELQSGWHVGLDFDSSVSSGHRLAGFRADFSKKF